MFANKDREAIDRLQEEAYYERVLSELSQGTKRQGLWLKAMTLSDGNEAKARLKYIELAIQAYKDEDHVSSRINETTASRSAAVSPPVRPHTEDLTPNPSLASTCRQGIIFTYVVVFALSFMGARLNEFGFIFLIPIALFLGGLAKSIGENKWIYGFLGLIPIVNLIAILILFNKSNKIFKALSYKLSFFGGVSKA